MHIEPQRDFGNQPKTWWWLVSDKLKEVRPQLEKVKSRLDTEEAELSNFFRMRRHADGFLFHLKQC